MERVESFRRMVETLMNQQAERQGIANGTSLRDLMEQHGGLRGFKIDWNNADVEITDEMRAEAAEMVAEGGYFSVENTAARILDFEVALTGGDPSKIDTMRGAVQKAFDQTERIFGKELPEITMKTHEAVMNGFNEWAEAGSASAITLLNNGM